MIIEELGDLLYLIVFLSKIAEKENRFKIIDVITNIYNKLIRRHPHVFSNVKIKNEKDVEKLWKKIKKEEKEGRRFP